MPYNQKQAMYHDLCAEHSKKLRKLSFCGVKLYPFFRGSKINTKSNSFLPSWRNFSLHLFKLIRELKTEGNLYIGFSRDITLEAARSLGSLKSFTLSEDYRSHQNDICNTIITMRLLFAATMLPYIILVLLPMSKTHRQMGIGTLAKVYGNIITSKLLISLIAKDKQVFFWGVIPNEIAFCKQSQFYEIQHGVVHDNYPTVGYCKRVTPILGMLPAQLKPKNQINFKLLPKTKLRQISTIPTEVGLALTSDDFVNQSILRYINLNSITITATRFHPKSKDSSSPDNCDFDRLLCCGTIYAAPSSLIIELLISNYQGTIKVLVPHTENRLSFIDEFQRGFLGGEKHENVQYVFL